MQHETLRRAQLGLSVQGPYSNNRRRLTMEHYLGYTLLLVAVALLIGVPAAILLL